MGILFLPDHVMAQKKWRAYTDCTLIPNRANDGDSFHVNIGSLKTAKAKHKLIRIYFADTPESEASLPERLEAQRQYWNLPDTATVMKLGKEATKFTENFLKDGFTIYSRLADAGGRSALDRDYGMIINNKGECLATALVRNGLARVFGNATDLSELKEYKCSADTFWKRLRAAENEAKREKRGAWALSGAPLSRTDALFNVRDVSPQDVVTTQRIRIYDINNPAMPLGDLNAGITVHVLGGATPDKAKIRFTTSGGRTIEGLARFVDLGI